MGDTSPPNPTEEIKAITEEANKRIHARYPLLEKPISNYMTQIVLEVAEERRDSWR